MCVKRRPDARSQRRMKLCRRKPNIPELVYKFLGLGNREVSESPLDDCSSRCPFCKRPKRAGEVLNSLDTEATVDRRMANKRKDTSRNSKSHRVKRRQTPKNQNLSSCMHRCSGGEGTKKMKKYVQKALDFGVESGYLIPKDAAYRVLRVSSDLMRDSHYMSKSRHADRVVSRNTERSLRRTPIRFEDYEVQDARRRKRSSRRRRRSRSGSRRRRRGRRRSGSENPDEPVENEDDYDYDDKPPEKRKATDTAKREEGKERVEQSDGEKTAVKRNEEGSDVSMDEDESEEDDEKKGDDGTKS